MMESKTIPGATVASGICFLKHSRESDDDCAGRIRAHLENPELTEAQRSGLEEILKGISDDPFLCQA